MHGCCALQCHAISHSFRIDMFNMEDAKILFAKSNWKSSENAKTNRTVAAVGKVERTIQNNTSKMVILPWARKFITFNRISYSNQHFEDVFGRLCDAAINWTCIRIVVAGIQPFRSKMSTKPKAQPKKQTHFQMANEKRNTSAVDSAKFE